MATTMIDGALGLVPMYTPLASHTRKVIVTDGVTVGRGTLVAITDGEIVVHAAGADGPAFGVSMDYIVGDGVKKATVCTDPDMLYRVLSDAAYDATEMGYQGIMASVGVTAATGNSSGVFDGSSLTSTHTVKTILTQVGAYEVVSGETNLWILVKINDLLLEQSFDLDTDT